METRRNTLIALGLGILILLSLAGLTWANYQYTSANQSINNFLPAWQGTRSFMYHGWSPYGEQVTREIQTLAYGRSARPDEDPLHFLYPLHSIFVFGLPALIEDFALARAVWMTVLEVAIIVLGGLGLLLSQWRISRRAFFALIIFVFFWLYSILPLLDGNVSILCAMFIAAAFLAIRSDHDVLAGILLALSAIRPQMIVLLGLFILIWGISHRRWPLLVSFLGSLALMIASMVILLPDWIREYLRLHIIDINRIISTTPGSRLAEWLPGVGRQMGWALTIFMLTILIVEWRASLRKDLRWFLWTACLTLVVTNLVGIPASIYNYVFFIPAIILALATWDERWGRVGRWLMILSIAILFFGLWGFYVLSIQKNTPLDQSLGLYFFTPLYVLLGLYWVRMWAIRPLRMPMEVLAERLE